jgi:hypothetical protein
MTDYFENIDEIPVHNWFKIAETNDMKFMLKKNKSKFDRSKALKKYEELQRQYFEEFGFGESYEKTLMTRANIVSLKIEKLITGNDFLINFIKQAEIDLNDSFRNAEKINILETKIHIEKYIGFRLNDRDVSVKEFYTYLNVMSKDSKK